MPTEPRVSLPFIGINLAEKR